MYKLTLSNKALKELKKINNRDYLKISDKILELETEPRPVGSIKLQGKDLIVLEQVTIELFMK